ncbi:hypothetical protein EV126DRAFT_80689 [Verticillium dahliae]|nr:hypothetical protein EV126DRAFT_80689 [Verticillium dahliae]
MWFRTSVSCYQLVQIKSPHFSVRPAFSFCRGRYAAPGLQHWRSELKIHSPETLGPALWYLPRYQCHQPCHCRQSWTLCSTHVSLGTAYRATNRKGKLGCRCNSKLSGKDPLGRVPASMLASYRRSYYRSGRSPERKRPFCLTKVREMQSWSHRGCVKVATSVANEWMPASTQRFRNLPCAMNERSLPVAGSVQHEAALDPLHYKVTRGEQLMMQVLSLRTGRSSKFILTCQTQLIGSHL